MACGKSRNAVGRNSVAEAVAECAATVGVFARKVEEVYAREDDEESAEEGNCVDGVCGIEAAEEKEGRDEGAGGEGNVVEGIDTVR